MITGRELTFDDYVAMFRRRLWLLLVPALVAPAVGFAVSYFFAPTYTASSTILVEEQKVPGNLVTPLITEDVMRRISGLQQQMLSRNRLLPVVERFSLAKGPDAADAAIQDIRNGLKIVPVGMSSGSSTNSVTGKKKSPSRPDTDVAGFNLNFTYSNPHLAQQLCNELTSMLIEANIREREQTAQGTTDFLARQVDEAKRSLDEQDAKLAAFKRQYVGQLPEDADSNLKILMGLNSQLDAATQTVNRAQQDKAYAESTLAQQLAAWRNSDNSTSPQALEQRLTALQSQLIQLQARYTDDYPDVIKTKADIAETEKKLNQGSSGKVTTNNTKADLAEPPEIRQLRVQIHQYEDAAAQATQQQKRLQDQIKVYQGRVATSPAVEEQYKQITRDYDSARKFYDDLLAKRSQSAMATDMERQQQGEQFTVLNPASLPTDPSFPNRLLFAGGGLAAGLALGCALAFWLEFKDKAIRNELDVESVMGAPALISLPWVSANESANGRGMFGRATEPSSSEKQPVEI